MTAMVRPAGFCDCANIRKPGARSALPLPSPEGACGHAAGQIVIQIEQRRGALLVLGQMQSLLRVLKEDVRVIAGAVEVEEAEIADAPRFAHFGLISSGKP